MSKIIQPETFSALEATVLDIYSAAALDPTATPGLSALAKGNAEHPTLAVSRQDRDNATFLAIIAEGEAGKDITQIHRLGWYITGTALLLDSKGAVSKFQEIDDSELLEISAHVRERYEAGAFNKKRFLRSLLTRS